MSDSTRDLERLSDLAVDRLLGMLADDDVAEYRRLEELYPDFDVGAVERSAAALHLATGIAPESMPADLQRRLLDDATETFALRTQRPRSVASVARRRPGWSTVGWLATAACLGIALVAWLQRPSRTVLPQPPPVSARNAAPAAAVTPAAPTAPATTAAPAVASITEPLDPAADRARLLEANPHLVQRSWRAGGDPAGIAVSGDVVWDPSTQTGYMRFVGLRRNEPNAEQYQLWIFDATRDERYPVDGGVFNVAGARDGDVVPIKAKLRVGVALMFAVTIERPGGVVVSERERIVAIANTT
jgi:hypothetical protein